MMKKTNYSTKKAFTIAELLISMLVVCVVAAALVPMIGPKKTKALRQKMVHGYYACYYSGTSWDNNLTIAQKAYSRNPKTAGSGAIVNDHCEFSPPKANFYNITVIAASGDGIVTNQDKVSYQIDTENNSFGQEFSDTISVKNYQQDLRDVPEIISILIDKVLSENGPLSAKVDLISASGGSGSSARETSSNTWDDEGWGVYQGGGGADSPGASAGESKKIQAYLWMNKSTNISYSEPGTVTDPVSLTLSGSDYSEFIVNPAGRGSDAFDLFSGGSVGSAGMEIPTSDGSRMYLENGQHIIVSGDTNMNQQIQLAQDTGEGTQKSYFSRTIRQLIEMLFGGNKHYGSGSNATASVSGAYQTSGTPSCNVRNGVCPNAYQEGSAGRSGAPAPGRVDVQNAGGGFGWYYKGLGVRLRATRAGENGEFRVRMFNKLDGKLRIYPARTNMANGQLTKTRIELIKAGTGESSATPITLMEVTSGRNANAINSSLWVKDVGDYTPSLGPFPLALATPEVVPKEVIGLPVVLGIDYIPGKAGNGGYPFIEHIDFTPEASITSYPNKTYTKVITEKAFDKSFSPTDEQYKCPDGYHYPESHSTAYGQQYYCKARKGNPGVVVISW